MNRQYSWLIFIFVLTALAAWIDFSDNLRNPVTNDLLIERSFKTQLGLDLRGGLQVLLEVPESVSVTQEDLNTTKTILENRANGLGVSEVLMQVAPPRRIIAEFPGVSDPEKVVASLKQTGLLEFVEMGTNPPPAGTLIETDFDGSKALDPNAPAPTAQPTSAAVEPTPDTATLVTPRYHTVMTGTALETVTVQTSGGIAIGFILKPEWADFFSQYTLAHRGQALGIVLDKRVISTPMINDQIPSGQGTITGDFTIEEANAFANQLRYGSLPVPIEVVESRTIGPSLGAESIQKSLTAGIIGLLIVMLFMILYYRLPGALANVALLIYTLLSFALFKTIPVVLTLPGIAGFILSIGMAVDANVLIFERLKEELRSGRTLRQAIDLGWNRAWSSIRDSNSSTLITCVILYWFGSTFGASLVKGFSVTLALGVLMSLFTAVFVTRTFLHVMLDNVKLSDHPRWFGL